MGRKEEVAVGLPVYERNGIPSNALIGDPKGIPIQQTIYRDTPAPYTLRLRISLAVFVGCLMPMMVGVCFLCLSMDCLCHKYHYCPDCQQKELLLYLPLTNTFYVNVLILFVGCLFLKI